MSTATGSSGLGLVQIRKELVRQLPLHFVLLSAVVVIMVPFAWTLSVSLSELGAVFSWPVQWIPNPVRWDNYVQALTKRPFGLYFRNTTFMSLARVVAQMASSSLVAFSFARLRWPGRDKIFLVVLATMMLPWEVTMIPQFIMFSRLNWVNTFAPLIVPSLFASPFYIFLLRQFYMTISLELDDAAKIDGASVFQIYARILLPLCKPALATVAIFEFQGSWNDFLAPLIYLHSQSKWVVALGLKAFLGQYMQWWNLMMAASLVAMLPVLLLFAVGQRYFVQGVVFTGLKQ